MIRLAYRTPPQTDFTHGLIRRMTFSRYRINCVGTGRKTIGITNNPSLPFQNLSHQDPSSERYNPSIHLCTVPCQKSSRNLVKSRKIATHQNHALISTSHHAMNRTPLGPINGNKTHRKELTPFTRGFILGKLTSDVIPPQIKREIHAPHSIIRSVLRASEWQEEGASKPRSGRPTIVIERARRYIIRYTRNNPKIIYLKLCLTADIEFNRSTIYRILKEYRLAN